MAEVAYKYKYSATAQIIFDSEDVEEIPAENIGGLKYIKSVSSVFPLKFMPTGGITEANLEEYLRCGKVCACGGTWLAKKDMIASKEWDKIEENCKRAVSIINKCRKV